jgi:hypothetical protein
MFRKICFIIILSGLCALTAQENAGSGAASDSTAVQSQLPQNNVKIFIDKIEVEGTLEKPQAVFILPGQTPEIDDILIERSFVKEIFRPVEKRTVFETTYRPESTRSRKDVLEW